MQIIRVSTYDQLQQCLQIRWEVFVDEQNVPEHLEIDEWDEGHLACRHVLLCEEQGLCTATARMRNYSQDTGKIQRVAVRKIARQKGHGRLVLNTLEEWARELGLQYIILDSQCHAENFYLKLGYVTISSEPFDDAGIPHVRMRKKLA
ncbi:MAG: GNAT family N-acetyltransferase [Paenibacillus sp. RIFOXYA1_FULL_44_5]|nr:MAG: GNAT family N-acetyltransferase [Paenibacillus sp. RIFOXYA1_FULL_44_5]